MKTIKPLEQIYHPCKWILCEAQRYKSTKSIEVLLAELPVSYFIFCEEESVVAQIS